MTTIATLTIDLLGNSANLRNELKRANQATDDWAKKVRQSASVAAKAIVGVGVAAATGLAALYTVTADSIDQQAKLADSIGLTTAELSGLRYAGELTGVSTDKLDSSMTRFVRRLGEAERGSGAAKSALQELGLENEAFFGLNTAEQFRVVADRVNELSDSKEKAAMVSALFGREGIALVNTLSEGSDGIAAMQAEAAQLGITLSRVDAAKVEQANDAFYKAGQISKGFSQQLTAELAPIVEGVATEFLNASLSAGGMGEVATMAADAIVKALDVVYAGLLSLKNGWNVVKYASITAAQFGVEALVALEYNLKSFINTIPGLHLEMSEGLGRSLAYLRDASNDAFDDMSESAGQLATQVVAVFNGSGKVEEITREWRHAANETAKATAATKEYGDALFELKDLELPSISSNDSLEKELDSLRRSLQSRESLIIEQTQKELEILRQAKEQEYITAEEYDLLHRELMNQRFQEAAQVSDDFWMQFAAHVEKSVTDFDTMWGNAFNRFAAGLGDAVADSIMEGENFGDVMAGVARGMAKSMISALVEIAAKRATLWLMEKTLLKTQQSGFVAKVTGEAQAGAALASINSFASAAAIPVTGWAIAPGVAASALAINEGMAAMATAAAAGSLAGMAHSGIDNIPSEGTWLLDKGERVLSPQQNSDLTQFLQSQKKSGGSGGGVVINMNGLPDGYAVAEQTESEDEFGRKVVDVLMIDQRNGGEITSGFQGMWGLKRQGQF